MSARTAGALVAGLALGAVNSMSNAFGSPYGPFTENPGHGVLWLEYLGTWIGTPWAWAVFAFAVGWFVRRPGGAAWRAAAALLLAVMAYYACDGALRVTDQLSVIEVVFWSGIALVVGPVMAALGALARGPRRWSLLPALAAPAVMVYFELTRPSRVDHLQPLAQRAVLAAAALLAMAFVARALTRWRTPTEPRSVEHGEQREPDSELPAGRLRLTVGGVLQPGFHV